MKTLIICHLFFLSNFVLAAQKAKIIDPEVEIYSDADFDSEVITTVYEGESYFISDKVYGPFYRIKIKNGKIGYIVDYELDIEGKGRLKEEDLDEVMFLQIAELAKETKATAEDKAEETNLFGRDYSGPTLQLVNYHENSLSVDQVDNLTAIGYKKISDMTWSVLGSFKVPKYYIEKTGNSAQSVKIWADFGFSSAIANFGRSEIRFAGSLFTHISLLQLKTVNRNYDLNDISLGVALEAAWLIKIHKYAIDFTLKYYFDKSNYTGFGLSFLF